MFAHKMLAFGFRKLGLRTQIEFSRACREVQTESEAIRCLKKRDGTHSFDIERDVNEGVGWLFNNGWEICYPGSSDFPEGFYRLPQCPIFICYKGGSIWRENSILSVVGGREPSRDSLTWIEGEFGNFLRSRAVSVASGGARGIDQKAHSISLLCGRPTAVFLPAGGQHLYPQSLEDLLPLLKESGSVMVSEYLPNTRMQKAHFQERNRLIAALANHLLVVQCREKSGSLITARYALQLGVDIGVVPWSPMDARAAGSNRLLYEGAQMIRDGCDLDLFMGSVPDSFHRVDTQAEK